MLELLTIIIGLVEMIFLMLICSTFSWGWVCFKFWTWFVLPVFVNLPHITYVQAIGLMMFIGLFRNHSTKSKDESGYKWMYCYPWITLFFGYIVKLICF